jgi:hypothetical protein
MVAADDIREHPPRKPQSLDSVLGSGHGVWNAASDGRVVA